MGPSFGYLSALAPFVDGSGPVVDAGAPLDGGMSVAPPAGPAMSVAPPMPPPPAGPPHGPPVDAGPNMSVPPPPEATSSQAPPAAPSVNAGQAVAGPNPSEYFPQLSRVGQRVVPAHEVEMRGPQLKHAQEDLNASTGETIRGTVQANQSTAQDEYNMYLRQEQSAQARQAAAETAQAQRDEELQQRQADFDQSSQALGQMAFKPDGGFWASKSVPQRISAMISIGLGGFIQGVRGGPNPALDAINTEISREVDSQQRAYMATRDSANAAQNAFTLAMQKYGSLDAARSMVRAAALDAVGAQMAQNAAKWKGTEAGTRAMAAMTALSGQKMEQVAQGVRFVQPTAAGGGYVDQNGVQYTNKDVQGLQKERRDALIKRDESMTGIGKDVTLKGMEVEERRLESANKRQDKDEESARSVANSLQQAGVPQARTYAEKALAALNASPGGVGDVAVRSALGDAVGGRVLGRESITREQAYGNFKNAFMKTIAGNVTASEEARLDKALGTASDPESRKFAVTEALDVLNDVEKNIKAGASGATEQKFDARREEASGGKAAAPKSAVGGWK